MRDVYWVFHALRMAWASQRVRKSGVTEAAARVCTSGFLPRHVPPEAAVRAAARACRVAAWFGGLNSCLVRSLVAGALLSDRDDVVLHIGFRHDTVNPLDGHAWVSVAGVALERGAERFLEAMTVRMQRK